MSFVHKEKAAQSGIRFGRLARPADLDPMKRQVSRFWAVSRKAWREKMSRNSQILSRTKILRTKSTAIPTLEEGEATPFSLNVPMSKNSGVHIRRIPFRLQGQLFNMEHVFSEV